MDRDRRAGCGRAGCLAATTFEGGMINHVETGCLLPFFQSLITGALVGLIAAGAATWMELTNPWMLGLIIGAVGSLWWWTSSIHLWRVDVYGYDEQVAPEPVQSTVSTVRVEVVNDSQIVIADLPASPAQLRDLSTGLLAGMSFSEASWSGDGRIFSKSEFHAIRQAFIGRGWARWRVENAPAQGVAITAPGRAVLRELAQHEA